MFGKARQHYTKALGLAPNDPSIMANVGLSYALEGDPQTAEIWLRRAANMPGASANVRQNLALVLGLQDKLDEAEKWANQDMDQNETQGNMDYLRSLRGAAPAAPRAASPAPSRTSTRTYGQAMPTPPRQRQLPLSMKSNTRPPSFGARLTMAGDPNKTASGPQNAREAALQAARQQKQRQPPSPRAQLNAQPTAQQRPGPKSVLSQIAQKNLPKRALASHQQQQLAPAGASLSKPSQAAKRLRPTSAAIRSTAALPTAAASLPLPAATTTIPCCPSSCACASPLKTIN